MARTCSRREIKRVESIIPNRDFTVRASRETRKLKGRRNIHFFSRFSNSEFQSAPSSSYFPNHSSIDPFLAVSSIRMKKRKLYPFMYLHLRLYLTLWSVTNTFFFTLNFIFFLIILLFLSRINLYRAFTLIWSNLYVCIFVLKETLKGKKN